MEPPLLYRQLQQQLRQWVQPKDQRHLQGFAEIVAAILQSKSACLGEWIAYLRHRTCTARAHMERLSYFVHHQQITAERFYEPMLHFVLQAFAGESVLLTLDTSMLWDKFCLIEVCFVWGGRSFTLAQVVLEHGSAMVGFEQYKLLLDRATRYIPLSALYDGKHYLVENFAISTILTAGTTDTIDRLSINPADTKVLGLGLSNAVPGFNPLPNVEAELNGIIRTQQADSRGIFPGSEFLNQSFDRKSFNNLIDYRILHIATHGKFVSGQPEDSFLVLGNGDPLRIPEIKSMTDLNAIHLVVLSACETAKGGEDKEGLEVSGISYYFITSGAKAVIASLWLVNDASTALMMQRFYQNLPKGMSKTEALRQVQLQFIQGKLTAKDASNRASIRVSVDPAVQAQRTVNFSHPYYWAPFILIGNNL